MKHIIFVLFILSTTLYAQINITGTWELFNKKHPFNCCSLSSYSVLLRFNQDATIDRINSNTATVFKFTKRMYTLKNNKLNVHLENKDFSIMQNFMLTYSSSNKTFQLKRINAKCLQAIDVQQSSNNFIMCKKNNKSK